MDALFRREAKALGWCAVAALGYEVGSWMRVCVSDDPWSLQKTAQSFHPEQFAVRVALFAANDRAADAVQAEVLAVAELGHQRLNGSCVALGVGAVRVAIEDAARRLGVTLHSVAEWEAAIARRIRGGV